jgi:hypothetical protein
MIAKMVIASVARDTESRHFARSRYRIAEMSVPEWAIPTQNTKLAMYTPQSTG